MRIRRQAFRCQRDHVIGALAESELGLLPGAQLVVPGLKAMSTGSVVADEVRRGSVEIDVVLKAGEPVGQAGCVVGAARAIERQAAARPESECLRARAGR